MRLLRIPTSVTWQRLPSASILLVGSLVSSLPWSLRGMNWSDYSQFLHFGGRLLDGELPYRDYVFQVGWFPVALDAAAQAIFGRTYASSVGCGLALRFACILLISCGGRNATGSRAVGIVLALSWAFSFPVVHHSSYLHADLAILGAIVLALPPRAEPADASDEATSGTRARERLACAVAGLALGSRQNTAVACLGLLLMADIAIAAKSSRAIRAPHGLRTVVRESWTAPFLLGATLTVLPIAPFGLAPEWFREVLIDAREKKRIDIPRDLLDALSGGLLHLVLEGTIPWWRATFAGGVPFLLGAAASAKVLRDAAARTRTARLACFSVLGASCVGFLLAERPYTFDAAGWTWSASAWFLPYGFLGGAAVIGTTRRDRSSFALMALVALSHALSHQLSWKGPGYMTQGWNCNVALGTAASLIALRALAPKGPVAARRAALALLASALVPFLVNMAIGGFGRNFDGPAREQTAPIEHPMAAGVRVSIAKKEALAHLRRHVRPGDTCYVHGSSAILYDLLGCRNPTRLDIDTFDFATRRDGREALEALRRSPPDWIITALGSSAPLQPDVRDTMRLSPDPDSAILMALGLDEILRGYRPVPAPLLSMDDSGWGDMDRVRRIRLHRRVDPPAGERSQGAAEGQDDNSHGTESERR